MVAPCGAGSGIIRAGFERATYVGAAAAEALVAEFGTPAAAIILAPVIAAATYDLLHICNAGDPGDPVLTIVDMVDAVTGADVLASQTAWNRIQQWFTHMMWPVWCDCSNGVVPPVATTAPLPSANNNPGLPSGVLGSKCWDVNATVTFPTPPMSPSILDAGNSWLPGALVSGMTGNPDGSTHAYPVPAGVTAFRYDATSHYLGAAPTASDLFVAYYSAAKAQLRRDHILSATTTLGADITLPAGSVYWQIYGQNDITDSPWQVQMEFSFFCGGNSTATLTTPCCPPDPLLDQRLTQIIQLERAIIQLLGQPLHGTVDGTRHAGLSGNGTVTLVDNCPAVRIEIKSGLSLFAKVTGSPDYYFGIGFITPVSGGSPLRGSRLTYATQTYPLQPLVDQVGYSIFPGVTFDLVELLPGP